MLGWNHMTSPEQRSSHIPRAQHQNTQTSVRTSTLHLKQLLLMPHESLKDLPLHNSPSLSETNTIYAEAVFKKNKI